MNSTPPTGYVLQSPDSSYWAERLQFEHWRQLDDVAKSEGVRTLCLRMHALHLLGLRDLHPNADERELELRAAALRLGAEFVKKHLGFDVDA